ncbi:MAG: antibiotic biosynthesis monooxygenase family protein [Moheibacter sp.]
MIAVIFEVWINDSKKDEYLEIASQLREELVKLEGFISIERFQSLSDGEKLLSLSFWENEEAVIKWRNFEQHRQAQKKGRNSIFKDYRIRIGTIIRDYGFFERTEAPLDSVSSLF